MNPPRRPFVVAVLAVAFVAAACSGGGGEEASPTPTATSSPSAEAVIDTGEVVRFATPDDVELEGSIYGEGTTGVVLAHMRGRDRSTWAPFAAEAAAAGHHVLAFDFRGYGGSNGERDSSLDVDLIAAVRFLQSRDVSSVVVVGASMGATATINVAAQLDLAGAVAISAPDQFGALPALDVAANVGEPLLVVVAEADQPYADTALEIAAAAPATQLQVFDGNAHGTNLFGSHPDDLSRVLLSFIGDRLG